MPDITLVASRDFSYATRRLRAGESFTVSERDAKILRAIGKAETPRVPGAVRPPSPTLAAKIADHSPLDHDGKDGPGGSISAADEAKAEVVALRAEYTEKLGKRPFPGWDAATLREKIAAPR